MAIWPFGRKGKRPRSQMKASDAVGKRAEVPSAALSPVPEQTPIARKPSRKRSKRDKRRSTPSRVAAEPLPTTAQRSVDTPVGFAYNLDNHTSLSSIGQDNFISRATPTLQKRASTTSKGTLKKRLSKRSARELQREQEIRAMSSSPPAIHPHPAAFANLGRSTSGRHADHHFSNQSLPIDSRSSLSDNSDSYTYKVNAFAVLAPRPILRCSDSSKYGPPRSTNPSATSMRKDIKLGEEEDYNSRRRIAELADDLDAPALRELMERDRRRREKKRQENQERIQRRLQRRAERDREQERNMATSPTVGLTENLDDLRGRDKTPSPATSSKQLHAEEGPVEPTGSWLRGSSKESQRKSNRFSDISSHVIGNIDDRSIRAGKTGEESMQQPQSPPQSHSSPRITSLAPESVSDVSRSEKRLSDNSGRRMGTWMSFFSRSPRSKASRDIDAPSSDFSNTSRESFSKIQSTGPVHSAAVPIPIPERSFLRTGTSHRSQSKFTEHLGDYPISPPDSRVQSPIPVPFERSTNISPVHESAADASPQRQPDDADRAWDDNSGMLSQSLASIDSEGSWMSGKFLRRISQNTNNTAWRSSAGKTRLQETNEMDDVTSDEYFNEMDEEPLDKWHSAAGLRRASSSAMGLEAADSDRSPSPDANVVMGLETAADSGRAPSPNTNATESWRGGVARKPTVVRHAAARAQSREVMLTDIDMLDASMDESPISPVSQDEEPVEIQRAHSVDYGRGHKHARQMSAGSAKLLDIPPRSSVDSTKDHSTEQI